MTEIPEINTLFDPLLMAQQFTSADVLAVTGLSSGQLKGILDRNQITLSANHNPGTGKRRMFTGQDLIALSATHAASRIGFPLRWGNVLAQQFLAHARRMQNEAALGIQMTHYALACYPANQGDDWAFVPVIDGKLQAEVPTAYHFLDMTREIDQTIAKLKAIVGDEAVPAFATPQPPEHPDNHFAPRSNFFRAWEKDPSGEWCYVGLTLQETSIVMKDQGVSLDGDDIIYVAKDRNNNRELLAELAERHEAARLKACFPGDVTE